jgi:YD repeat-containing protein
MMIGCGGGTSSSKKCYMPTDINYEIYNTAGHKIENNFTFQYDGNGYLVERFWQNKVTRGNDTRVTEHCNKMEYNDNYQLISDTEFRDKNCENNITSKNEYKYNDKSLLIENTQIDYDDGQPTEELNTTLEYNSDNKLKYIYYDNQKCYEFTYNTNSISQKYLSINEEQKYILNSKNQIIEYYFNDSLENKYSYNNKGYIEKIYINDNNKTINFKYTYYKTNAQIKQIDINYSDNNGTLKVKWQEFDSCNYNIKDDLLDMFVHRPNDGY